MLSEDIARRGPCLLADWEHQLHSRAGPEGRVAPGEEAACGPNLLRHDRVGARHEEAWALHNSGRDTVEGTSKEGSGPQE